MASSKELPWAADSQSVNAVRLLIAQLAELITRLSELIAQLARLLSS